MTVRHYLSTDAGSPPVLTGEDGALKDLLKQVLVGTSGVAYGTGGTEKLAAGWEIEFESGSKIALKGATGVASGMIFRFDDSGPGAGSYRDCRIRGYESMSDIDTGSNPFPTLAQRAETAYAIRKSSTLDSTARAWEIIADDRTCYLWVDYTGSRKEMYVFGDYEPFSSTDTYNAWIVANPTEGVSATTSTLDALAYAAGTTGSHYMARSYSGAAGAVSCGKLGGSYSATAMGGGNEAYPSLSHGGLLISPVILHQSIALTRGVMRGMYGSQGNIRASSAHGDEFSGFSSLPGRTLRAMTGYVSNTAYLALVDITGPW